MIVWGERDRTIPLEHGRAAHEAIPHSRFETLPRAAHFPTSRTPRGSPTCSWTSSRRPSHVALDAADWEELLASRTVRRRRLAPGRLAPRYRVAAIASIRSAARSVPG